MQTYAIATGQSRMTKLWKNTSITWEDLISRLETTTRTPESQGEYRNFTKSQQDNTKDVGGFVAGKLRGGRRKSDCVESRSLLTLDADFADPDFCDNLSMFFDFTYCVYSTHKHTPEAPRLRLIIPLSRPCTPDEYEAVARMVANDIGIDLFDDTTYQAHRLMHWPSTSIDGEYLFRHEETSELDVDKTLSRYGDWTDVAQWPVSSRTVKHKERLLKKQADPTLKPGILGAFCRAYSIDKAIEKFLPDIYAACNTQDRYTYIQGSCAAGLVVYNEGKFAYSNHATDPASGILCNSFDLVRIHRFGELDDDAKDGTPTNRLPSFMEMCTFAAADKDVALTMFQERQEQASKEFEGLDVEAPEDSEWSLDLEVHPKTGAYEKTLNNILLILEHDPRLRGKIAADDFAGRVEVHGVLPWDLNAEKERFWRDSDTDGLQWYLEHTYDISVGNDKTFRALSVYCRKVAHDPVKDYLDGLVWDGVERLDTLFIDYMGATDNEYVRAATRKIFTAAVARVYEPGRKFDNMLILSGRQGLGKSTILRKMGRGAWFTDGVKTFEGKELCELIQGKWIVEISELEALNKSEVGRVKQILSQDTDRFRAAYGRVAQEYPRRCVFFGTSNHADYLRDRTGNRRFWPIDTEAAEPAKSVFSDLDKEVDQLWAEAKERYKAEEPLFLTGEAAEIAEKEQEDHREHSEKEGLIREFIERKVPVDWNKRTLEERRTYWGGFMAGQDVKLVERERVCALEIWCELFGGDFKSMRYGDAKEINSILSMVDGWERQKQAVRCGYCGVQKGFKKCNL